MVVMSTVPIREVVVGSTMEQRATVVNMEDDSGNMAARDLSKVMATTNKLRTTRAASR